MSSINAKCVVVLSCVMSCPSAGLRGTEQSCSAHQAARMHQASLLQLSGTASTKAFPKVPSLREGAEITTSLQEARNFKESLENNFAPEREAIRAAASNFSEPEACLIEIRKCELFTDSMAVGSLFCRYPRDSGRYFSDKLTDLRVGNTCNQQELKQACADYTAAYGCYAAGWIEPCTDKLTRKLATVSMRLFKDGSDAACDATARGSF